MLVSLTKRRAVLGLDAEALCLAASLISTPDLNDVALFGPQLTNTKI
jgi:hypothetical protein